jgi:tetratricopeptide (TPR) repeat protein
VPTPSTGSTESAGSATPKASAAAGGYIPTPQGGPTPEWEQAVRSFRKGNTLQFQGHLDEAIEQYQQSIAAFPTAEAYTFLGWTYAWKGRLEDGIVEAKKAIQLDPNYGNPYNDIGLYLIELDRPDEAVDWLQKAMKAERYQERQFPYVNLGRIWTRKGRFEDAFEAFEKGVRIWRNPSLPDFPTVKARIAATSDASPPPGLVPQLKQAMDAYFEAWNSYSPRALIDASTAHPPGITEDLLLLLASAKLRGAKTVLAGLELRRFTEDVALVEADVKTDGSSTRTQYILQRDHGAWKVMGPAVVDEVPSSDSPAIEVPGQADAGGNSTRPRISAA